MSIQIASSDGSLKELTDVEYTLGTERSRSLFGSATAVLDACLVGMKKREVALLHCKELDYGEGARQGAQGTSCRSWKGEPKIYYKINSDAERCKD